MDDLAWFYGDCLAKYRQMDGWKVEALQDKEKITQVGTFLSNLVKNSMQSNISLRLEFREERSLVLITDVSLSFYRHRWKPFKRYSLKQTQLTVQVRCTICGFFFSAAFSV